MPHHAPLKTLLLGLPWWPSGLDSTLAMHGLQGQSLVGEPRSYMPPGMAPLQNKKKKKIQKTTTTAKNNKRSGFGCLQHISGNWSCKSGRDSCNQRLYFCKLERTQGEWRVYISVVHFLYIQVSIFSVGLYSVICFIFLSKSIIDIFLYPFSLIPLAIAVSIHIMNNWIDPLVLGI